MKEVEGDKASEIQEQRSIPHDLIKVNILTRLPIKTLMQFKLVSKKWNFTISSYDFGKLHLKMSLLSQPSTPVVNCLFIQKGTDFSLFDYQKYEELKDSDVDVNNEGGIINECLVDLKVDFDMPIKESNLADIFLVGSCNGLVCLASFKGEYFIIWNPSIHQWKKFEDPYVLSLGHISWAASGFGYVSSDDDYKVVRVLEVAQTLQIQVHVFSLRKNWWTRICRTRTEKLRLVYSGRAAALKGILVIQHGEPISFKTNHGVMVNKTVYWVVHGKGNERFVVACDLVHEMLDIAPHVVVGEYDLLCDIGGILSVLRVNFDGDASVSLLRQPAQEEVIPLYRDRKWLGSVNAIGFTRAGNFFVHKFSGEIGVFNPKSSEYSSVLTLEDPMALGHTRIASFVPSAISPLTMAGLQQN